MREGGGLSLILVLSVVLSVFSSFSINLLWKRGLVALLQLWYFCCAASCLCSVPRPHGNLGWSMAFGCGIAWSYFEYKYCRANQE